MMIIRKLMMIFIGLTVCAGDVHAVTIKSADEVFAKWLDWQRVMPDNDLSRITEQLDATFIDTFRSTYERSMNIFNPLVPFLDTLTESHINNDGYMLDHTVTTTLTRNLANMYALIENDMPGFVQYLQTSGFMDPVNKGSEERGDQSHDVIEKDRALFELLFAHKNEEFASQNLFSVANRFFEYCFGKQTFPLFQKMLLNKSQYPLARMLYAVTWYNLAGNGWKHWHENSLKILQERAAQGHKFVYIAGGSDLYQLIKAGIYTIRNIDPQLPSQPKYYTNDWAFILKGAGPGGGLGDRIVFNFPDRNIIMQRTGYYELGTTFKARIASGEVIEIPHSVTTWTILDAEGKKLGEYVLERRFCEQSDFDYEPDKTLMMSFNELYFIALPGALNGWNIDISKIAPNQSIVVKQLRNPVSRQMLVNMRIATLLNASDFKFIALGTCIN